MLIHTLFFSVCSLSTFSSSCSLQEGLKVLLSLKNSGTFPEEAHLLGLPLKKLRLAPQ